MPRIEHKTTREILHAIAPGRDQRADFTLADLRNLKLMGADLRNLVLLDASLNGTDLSFADLRAAQLGGADLRGVNLTGALLFGVYLLDAIYDHETRWPQNFNPRDHGAILVGRY